MINKIILCSFLSVTLAACGGGSSSSNDEGTSGQLTIGLTDAPVDSADAVVISFDAISIKPQSGDAIDITFDEALTVDVLSYQGDSRVMMLDGYTVEAGEYNWMRLSIVEDNSYIEVDGQQFPLEIPSGAQSGLMLNRGFTVAVGAVTDFTLDFDLRKSVHQEGTGDYKLRPTIRVIDSLEVGSIAGTVGAELITSELCSNGDNDDIGNAVYIFTGADQIPQDEQGATGDPLASVMVNFNAETESYVFLAGFIAAGEYTAAFTCDASIDVADEDNSEIVIFGDPVNITVTAGEASAITFGG